MILEDRINCRGKPAATVMTSSSGLSCFSPNLGEVKALKATKLAEEPELTNKQCFTPIH